MGKRNCKIIVDLHYFFEDHRKKAFLLINDKIQKISDLQNHIRDIFDINDFYLIKEDCYLPEEESIRLIEENDVIKVKPVKNRDGKSVLNEETVRKSKKKKHKHQESVENEENPMKIEENPIEIDAIEPEVKKKKKKSKSLPKEEEIVVNSEEIVVNSEIVNKFKKSKVNALTNGNDKTDYLAKNVLHKNYREPQKILPNTEEYLKNKPINIIRIDVIKSDFAPVKNSSLNESQIEINENLNGQFGNFSFSNFSKQKSESINSNLDTSTKMDTASIPFSSKSNREIDNVENQPKLLEKRSFGHFSPNESELNKNRTSNEKIEAENLSLNDPFINPDMEKEKGHLNSTEIEKSDKIDDDFIKNNAEPLNQSNCENIDNNLNVSKDSQSQSINNILPFNKYKIKKINSGIASFLNSLRQTVPDKSNLDTEQLNSPTENPIIPVNNSSFDKADLSLKNDDSNSVNEDDLSDDASMSNSTFDSSSVPLKIRRKRTRKRAKRKKKVNTSCELNLPPIINDLKPISVNCVAKPAIHIKFNDIDNEPQEKSNLDDKIEEISKPKLDLKENGNDQMIFNELLNPGDKIQFQILRISENYTPEYSSFITGEIKEIDLSSDLLRINISSGLDQCSFPNGKFQLEDEKEQIRDSLQEFKFADLLNVKLIK